VTITADRFAQGMTFAEYMDQMQENREKFAANYDAVEIPSNARCRVCEVGRPLNVLIITEDWCGDALTYLPVLGRLCACAGDWDMRVFKRDQNLDLADQYLNRGKWRSVPVVVFLDREMRELGRFIERPALVNAERQQVIDDLAATRPEIQAGLPYNEQTPEAQALISPATRALREVRFAAWQRAAVDEVCAALAKLAASGADSLPQAS
jgi:hypothetical protein